MPGVGKADKIFPSPEMREDFARAGYILPPVGVGVFLCGVRKCPYGEAGIEVMYADSDSLTGVARICNSNGLVEIGKGLLKDPVEEVEVLEPGKPHLRLVRN